jgi:cell division protease FtsH
VAAEVPDPSLPALPRAAPKDSKAGLPGGSPGAQPRPWWLLLVLAFLVANYLGTQFLFSKPAALEISYSFFKQQVEAGQVQDITGAGDAIEGTFKAEVSYPTPEVQEHGSSPRTEPRSSRQFRTRRPSFADPGLEALLDAKGVAILAVSEGGSAWLQLLIGFGPTLLLIGAFLWLGHRSAASLGGGMFGLGRSRAKRYSEQPTKVSFADVAGIDDAENELVEIVDFLKEPAKYQRLGGTMPKGVLLVGAPGTGKTLLARAIAGEAGVPFFSLSASEFIEMIVGVGAARVRDLFRQARETAPAIIFIDELDAIGRARGSGSGLGGHDEREQTLNQILTEMDGFDAREGVIVLAATNRADVLDPALLRPGRFDRRVVVQHPDRAGRHAILQIHTRAVPLATDVSLERIAAETPGLVGADLHNLVNEAALLAARKGASEVRAEDFSEALQKITLGPARHILLSAAERERTAYHEAGHALISLLLPGGDAVHRISIVPRGLALGATYQSPVDERTSFGEAHLRARITSALGGRAAEQLVYGAGTTGAESDLQHVTEIARHMVVRWGMSAALGPISFTSPRDQGLPAAFRHQPYSEATAERIDAEMRRIVEECQAEADRLLVAHRPALDALAQALLKQESLDERDIQEITGLSHSGRE